MADQSKKSRSGKHRRTSVGEFRTRANRRLSVEMIEGRLLLSVAPLTPSDAANTIFPALFAAPASGENSSGSAPTTPPASEQGGFINPAPPTVIHLGGANSIDLSSAFSSLQTSAMVQQAAYGIITDAHNAAALGTGTAFSNGINPTSVPIEFPYSDEGGPIGMTPMNRPLGQSPVGQEGSRVSADNNRNASSASSMLASAGISKLSGEWARPAISEVAGGEPTVAEKLRSKPAESDLLPTPLPSIDVEPTSPRHGAEADPVNSDSAQSQEIPVNTVVMREVREGDRLVDEALESHEKWNAAAKQSAFSTQPAGIFAPNSWHIDSILGDQNPDERHAPLILTLKPDDGPQKAAALKHTSMINLLRSSLSYEPVLVALLLDYVAARYYQHENKKRAGSTLQPVRLH